MDDLATLPTNAKTILTPEEQLVIDRYFPKEEEGVDRLKLIGLSALLFLILGNPLSEGLFDKLPLCNGNKVCIMVIKILVFVVALFLLSR